ncbi:MULTISPECIES: hypothetical protein [Bradyrhizobium]|uniref:Uncharacterized protein n=1 Tax=Bradyrhizobium nanningense TaxID=1325118 RepID=A0A4Q0S798_9BRAD|nr:MULTISPECIES: hypothetical protein [Bradyrhizobium]RXH24821.1 hypothetical protein XH84_32040 [Bradyrhizobium nanningense]RXH30180.1 hypothetical protein XH99_11930 [Bradyrhizobium nanningense]TQF28993.1 hypothetical protein UNPA324_04525 [Bradyrhizobium sp. UNPA324]
MDEDKEAAFLFEFFVENVIMPPGRWVLDQVGVRHTHEHEIAALFTGLAFWAFAVFLVFALVLGW